MTQPTDVVVYEGAVGHLPATLFGTADPRAIVQAATARAEALADVVRQKKLSVGISGREHVKVEGWTLLGSMSGVFAVLDWCRPLLDGTGWEARVEARTLEGQVVGAAEAQCDRSESLWKNRDDFAIRSMAQTRATGKALRLPLGFIMTLAGYEATPLEEMPHDAGEGKKPPVQQPRAKSAQPAAAAPAAAPKAAPKQAPKAAPAATEAPTFDIEAVKDAMAIVKGEEISNEEIAAFFLDEGTMQAGEKLSGQLVVKWCEANKAVPADWAAKVIERFHVPETGVPGAAEGEVVEGDFSEVAFPD